MDGLGSLGNGVATFSAWDVNIQEIQLAGDYNNDAKVDNTDYAAWKSTFGQTVEAGFGADGNGNGVVDSADYMVWLANLGQELFQGEELYPYNPAAIIVQTSGVTIPDGEQLDISGSQTSGLQEALDYSAANGWDVFVMPGTYELDAHLDLEETQLRTFRFKDATLNFSANVTDYGIRFDSTMQLNWYWKGGEHNAPHAVHGVLYQPRTPRPKDGPIHGTNGVYDSDFQWNVPILAGTHKVTMDSTVVGIYNTAFYFGNMTQSQVNYVGPTFAESNYFAAPRTDDPIPFDLFETEGRVTVIPPANQYGIAGPGSFATAFLPDGTLLDVSSSQTSGLQEAFDYAAANDLDLLVFGRGVRAFNPFTSFGHYTLNNAQGSGNTTLSVSNLTNRTYRIYGVTFLNEQVGGTIFEFNGLVNSDFEMTGEVVGPSANTVVHVQPKTQPISNSVIRMQSPVGVTPVVHTNVHLDTSLQSIEFSELYFSEVNQGQFGVKISNPSSSTYFRSNFLRTIHVHEYSQIAVQLGEFQANAERIHSNTVISRPAAATYPSTAALQVWGDNNYIDLVAVGGGQQFGAKFEPGSSNNTLVYGTLVGDVPIFDQGVDNTFISGLVGLNALKIIASPPDSSLQFAGDLVGPSISETNVIEETWHESTQVDLPSAIAESSPARLNRELLAADPTFSEFAEEEYLTDLFTLESIESVLGRSCATGCLRAKGGDSEILQS